MTRALAQQHPADLDLVELGQRIRAIREQMDLTQVELGQATGTNGSRISQIERGAAGNFSINMFCRILVELDADPEELLFGR